MREIKFRAWNKITNHFSDFTNEHKIGDINSNGLMVFMQYTGLKDKNGVEIYEGDICRCWGGCEFNGYHEYNKIYEVKWQGSGFEMMINDCGYGWNYSNGFEYIKVIGNIYENPELLKEG